MKQTLLKSIFILSIALFSCENGDEPSIIIEPEVSLGKYENSVFVLNEGNFGDGDGSVSAYRKSDSTSHLTIFETVNNFTLGDVVQSAIIQDSLMLIVVNNSNRIEVVNAYTFESVYSVTDVALPRYIAISGDKGYLTEWVSFTDQGRVTIFDLATGNIDSRITVGYGAEGIKVVDGFAYVANNFENTLSIIDLSDNSVETLTLTAGPNQMVFDSNGDLWVACAGGYDTNFNPANDGALHKVDLTTNNIETTFELNANYSAKIAINDLKSVVYFYVGNKVFSQNVSSASITEPLIVNEDATSIYGIGVDPATGFIYLGDSKFFAEDGEVYQYDSEGKLITTFSAGRGPNGFVFN
jgi:DNA-binding beta-propeller fold protein YncE